MSEPNSSKKSFGQLLRDARNAKGLTLRKFAIVAELSPTYVSKIERDEMSPPSEDTIKRIARILEIDEDTLLAEAGKISSDLTNIILEHPKAFANFLRTNQGRSAREIENRFKLLNPDHE
jgi:transcriptional regulator with XRE-family HTH domain